MNKDRFEKLIAVFKSQSLSKDEKEQMLKSIRYAIAADDLKKETFQKVSIFSRFFSLQIVANKRVFAAFSLMVLVLSSAGISKAAEQSLPGDFLYPEKTKVNEKIKTSFASTPQQKAEVASELTIKRLDEAEALLEQGKLDEVKKEVITKNLEKHNEEMKKNVNEVSKHLGANTATELDDQLDLSLEEHVQVLDKLAEEKEDSVASESVEDTKGLEDSEKKPEELKRDFKTSHSKKIIKELQQRAERSSHKGLEREEERE